MDKKDFLIVYQSFGNNTKDLSYFIKDNLEKLHGKSVDVCRIVLEKYGQEQEIPNYDNYDTILFGSFTWGEGNLHVEYKNFIADTIKEKPKDVAVFGTGDTQFDRPGMVNFCGAANRLGKFFNTNYEILKVEQHFIGSQESKVLDWINDLVK